MGNATTPADYADGTDFYARACEQSPWASAPSENDTTEPLDDPKPPSVYIHDPRPDAADSAIEWTGQLRGPHFDEVRAFVILYKTTTAFNRVLNGTTNPDDPRWHCHLWMRSIHQVMYDVRASLTAELHLGRDASLLIPPNDEFASLCWPTPSGGLLVYLDQISGACEWCLGCRSFVRAREQAPVSWVYFIQGADGGPVKIGRSASPVDRLSALQTANPSRLRIVAKMAGGGAVERSMHALFAADRIRPDGEWFRASQALTTFMREVGGASNGR